MSARRPTLLTADPLAIEGSATCGICDWDIPVYVVATASTSLAICRRPGCEFEAFYLHPEARLSRISTALEEEL